MTTRDEIKEAGGIELDALCVRFNRVIQEELELEMHVKRREGETDVRLRNRLLHLYHAAEFLTED